ncbi:outer membrane protein [Allopusillimonas ginsengisoli]|uniref:outer membrane protein n=1 Tax=Allopusillimonas ginsengisoli TaxID=453575 RepID=UPI0039C31653
MKSKSVLCLLVSALGSGSCIAADAQSDQGAYVGVFGGTGAAIATSLQQKGAVHLNNVRSLPIHANGSTGSSTRVSMGGVQAGYEWDRWNLGQARWSLKPAVELEGIFLGKYSPTGTMPVRPRALGTQYVTIPMKTNLLLANAVFTIQTPYSNKVFPYVGVGAGAAFVSIKGSDSANPSEPGINHFNSDPDASSTAFAMQLKAGIKGQIHKNLYLFTEYRYVSINATNYVFGATDYPGVHLPTAAWRVNLGRQQYNFVVAGLQYKF